MIAQLTGRVLTVGGTHAVLDLGGLGLLVQCTPATTSRLRPGESATLHTSLIVREDSLTLYGFDDEPAREAFEMLLGASGVGPRIAQAVCSVLTPAELRAAVLGGDLVTLTKVPGIGRKGAEKIVLELRDKVLALDVGDTPDPAPQVGGAQWRQQVADGLQGLGWSARDAEAACDRIAELAETDPAPGIGELMRAALRSLAR